MTFASFNFRHGGSMKFIRLDLFRTTSIPILLLFFAFTEIANGQTEQRYYPQQRQSAIGYFVQGHFEAAETLFIASLHGAETARDDFFTALNLSGLGDVFQSESRLPEAVDAYRRSLSILRRLPNVDFALAIVNRNLAAAETAGGHFDEAEKALNEASRIAQKMPHPPAKLTGQILNSVGMVRFYQGKLGKAESLFEAAMQTFTAAGPSLSADVGQCLNNLAEIYRRKHRFKQAEEAYKTSIALTERQTGPFHPDLILMSNNLGDMYLDLKRYDEAESAFKRSLSLLEMTKPVLSDRMIHTLHGLSKVYLKKDEPELAEPVLARAAEIAGTRAGIIEVPAVLETYSALLDNIGKRQQAQAVRSKAARTRASLALTVRVEDLN